MTMFWAYALMFVLSFVGVMLIFIILLQRGRGGGLAGALGGMGGQSAFGTKAGDVFTKITVAIAVVWVLLAAGSGFVLHAVVEETRFPGGREAIPDEPTMRPTDDPEVPTADPFQQDEPPIGEPAGELPPVGEPPADETPAPEAPADETPPAEQPAEDAPAEDTPPPRLELPQDNAQDDD